MKTAFELATSKWTDSMAGPRHALIADSEVKSSVHIGGCEHGFGDVAFLPRDAMHPRYILAMGLCPCLSVCVCHKPVFY